MRNIIHVGMQHELKFDVSREKTVPFLYPEAQGFQDIPEVFATGFMIGLMEWCCIEALEPALEEGEGSLGTYVQSTHTAATPVGGVVTVHATVSGIERRTVTWDVLAWDNLDSIGSGKISRTVVSWDHFNAKLRSKREKILHMRGRAHSTVVENRTGN